MRLSNSFLLVFVLLCSSLAKGQSYWVNTAYTIINSGTNLKVDNLTNLSNGVMKNEGYVTISSSTVNDASGTMGTGNGTIVLSGSSMQTISGSSPINFPNVVFNNSHGFTVTTDLKIQGAATFTNGILYVDDAKVVDFLDGSSHSGLSSSSFVDGHVKKAGTTNFVFPTGNLGKLAQIAVSDIGATSQTFTARYYKGAHADWDNFDDNNIEVVSSQEYWDLSRSIGSTGVDVTLYWNDGDYSGIGNTSDLLIGHYGTTWQETSLSPSFTGNGSVGTLTDGPINNFSEFTFTSKNKNNTPLPITLVSLEANPLDNSIAIDWKTATEYNSDFIEVQRSLNGIDEFRTLGTLKAQGFSNTLTSYQYIDNNINPITLYYYRLLMHDYDGKAEASQVVSGIINNSQLVAYPNPTQDIVNIVGINSECEYYITDNSGKVVAKGEMSETTNKISISKFPAGIYTIHIINSSDGIKLKISKI